MWKNKWTAAFVFWSVLTVLMIVVMPDLNKLVLEKGQITLPETSISEEGSALLKEYNNSDEGSYQFVFVFHNKDKLTQAEIEEVYERLEEISSNREAYRISESLFPIDNEEAEKQLVAEDGTTILAQLAVKRSAGPVEDVIAELETLVANMSMETYVTGSDVIVSDFAASTQEGVKKTEIIAVVFILVILIVIFRSPVIPVISLVTVGVSYLISLSIVALLVEHYNLPFSNFTQVFLVVVLFGVGTDYNILLYSRFKEELVKQDSVIKAISVAYQTAGKTVLYSGVAVLVGFVALSFTQFSLYKATAPVAIGVAVLLGVLYTLNPFFMSVLGMKIFWPIKQVNGHTDNKMWALFSRFAFLHPIVTLVLLALVLTPLILSYEEELNYNDLTELDDKYASKQGVSIIEKHYAAGFSSPISLVVKSDGEGLDEQQALAEIDALTETILQVPGVEQVYSVTRPSGERIEELYVTDQSATLGGGLGEAQEGVAEIREGLSEAEQQVNEPADFSGVQQLVNATNQLADGSKALQHALGELNSGLAAGEQGATELAGQLGNLENAAAELTTGVAKLEAGYAQLAGGFKEFAGVFTSLPQGINQAKQGYEQIEQLMNSLVASNAEMASNVQVQQTLAIAEQGKTQLGELATQLTGYSAQYEQLVASLNEANNSLGEVSSGLAAVQSGASQLRTGANELASGVQSAAAGAGQIVNESTQFVSGLGQLSEGQRQMQSSLEDLQSQMKELGDGLLQTTEGLTEIYDGLNDATAFLVDLSQNGGRSFFIPDEVLKGEEFAESLETYMNEDKTMTRFNIILSVNPFTEEAMGVGEQIVERVEQFEATSTISGVNTGLSGKTMANVDLQNISQQDFVRSLIVMMIGILLILLLVTKSFPQSLAIIATLFIATFAALAVTQFVTRDLLGQEMLSWNVPFFSMIMILAIGVDYSIFFIMRYNESKENGLKEIISAATQMGGVVLAAAVILGGTFAALMPSGIITLIQVAIAVIFGLIFLSCVLMPLFIPALFGLAHKLKKWNEKEEL